MSSLYIEFKQKWFIKIENGVNTVVIHNNNKAWFAC